MPPRAAGWDNNDRVPLGTAEVSPLSQASAYATFANDGIAVPDHVVREVRDRKGKIVYQAHPEKERAVTEDIAHDVTFALSSVVEQGTGAAGADTGPPGGRQDRNQGPLRTPTARATSSRPGSSPTPEQISTAVMYVRRQRRQW